MEYPTLSVRINGDSPNHHLWNNNGTWWVHFTVHLSNRTKLRIRRSLETKNISVARRRRDQILKKLLRFGIPNGANQNLPRLNQRTRRPPPIYVVGRKEEDCCWLVSLEPGQKADDQDIKMAQRFSSLSKATQAADANQATVFELVDDKAWPAILKEAL